MGLLFFSRSYGRPLRQIRVEANFVPFNPDILLADDDWSLLGRPFFHTYWTDCVGTRCPVPLQHSTRITLPNYSQGNGYVHLGVNK